MQLDVRGTYLSVAIRYDNADVMLEDLQLLHRSMELNGAKWSHVNESLAERRPPTFFL